MQRLGRIARQQAPCLALLVRIRLPGHLGQPTVLPGLDVAADGLQGGSQVGMHDRAYVGRRGFIDTRKSRGELGRAFVDASEFDAATRPGPPGPR